MSGDGINSRTPSALAPAADDSATVLRRWPLVGASALLALFGASLAGVTLFTANPVTINADQIARADIVVTAVPLADGQFRVEREWKHDADLGTVRVLDLDASAVHEGELYLLALTATGPSASAPYRVTPAGHSDPPIYAATPETLFQLAQLIRRGINAAPSR